MLLNLLPEIQEQVIGHCNASSLKNLACASSQCYHAVKESLWYSVKIPISCLARTDFAYEKNEKKLSNLRYTRILCFEKDDGYGYDGDGYGEKVGKRTKKKIRIHYRMVLTRCDPRILHTFSIEPNVVGAQCVVAAFQFLTGIEKLRLMYGELSNAAYRAISKLNHLAELDLSYAYTDDSDIRVICENLNGLKVLSLRSTHVGTGIGLVHIHKLQLLEELILSANEIYDNSLVDIGVLPLLKKLHLKNCIKITDIGLAHICCSATLEELSIRYAAITDVGMCHLRRLVTLRSLDLSRCYDVDNKKGISNIGLSYISNLVQLRELNINSISNITDAGLAWLSRLTLLKTLRIRIKNITNDGVAYLRRFTNLEELDLRRTSITDLALSYICTSFPKLKLLDIIRTNVSDIGISYLMSVRSIKKVKYSNSAWDNIFYNSDESEFEDGYSHC